MRARRVGHALESGQVVSISYDPTLGKVIADAATAVRLTAGPRPLAWGPVPASSWMRLADSSMSQGSRACGAKELSGAETCG